MKWHHKMLLNLPYFICLKTQSCVFHFSFHATLFLSPNECPGLCQHRPWHSLGEKIKQYEMKNRKSNFFVYIKYGKFWSISPIHFIKHKRLISEECYYNLWQLNSTCPTTWVLNGFFFQYRLYRKILFSKQYWYNWHIVNISF